ncbi:hypothetical protein LTR70_009524 [Exophiala xenobiotica]|uniref:SCP domain-containing protein n=1 Tax=Lithohypha guttulata TaxID=1690604 RepID=A0ABR0K058_9EURO|nr:hypothetical protein LTR24_008367 [Lithohypha guttulata]KAK5310381.1 hypothetical protein LTR70_009524 [Exophiala xenobiotica]
MYTIKAISLLALAGSAIAAPWSNWNEWKGDGDNNGDDNNNNAVETKVAVVTAYTTVVANGNWGGNGGYKPTATAAPQQQEATVTQQAQQEETSTWAAWSTQTSAPAASPTAPASGSSNGGYMDVVSEWRAKMGMSPLAEDSTLQANALKTAADGNGNMVHQLNEGSFGQVLAPGDASEFERCFVGGWLCLDGVCSTMSQGWAYGGQTGHAELLSSTKYSKIGCGNAGGIWACDLA